MGVAGCGKSAFGAELARRLGLRFIEGDALQPPENVDRMRRGEALTDALRAGWLDAMGEAIRTARGQGGSVAACSALKRSYRDRLRLADASIIFVHLCVGAAEARRRVAGRTGHFMPASLVDSQFATLEPLAAVEAGLTVDGERPIGDILAEVLRVIPSRDGRPAE
jgi:gluconokinase